MAPRRLIRNVEISDGAVQVPVRGVSYTARIVGDSPEALMAAAHAEAHSILAAAEEQRAGGFEAGYAAGIAQAQADAHAEVHDAVQALRHVVAALEQRIADIEQASAPAAAAFAVEVAARVLRAEVAARPERVVEVVRGAMRRAADRERIVVRVNPADLAACRDAAPDLLSTTGGVGRLDFFDDQRITPGSCVVETNLGDVDATFESQLARIHEALLAPPDDDLVEGR
ncbi:MAG: FliH/SctL family protein [Actinomycetota bacterium]